MKRLRVVSLLVGMGALILTALAVWRAGGSLLRVRESFVYDGVFLAAPFFLLFGDLLWRLVLRWPLMSYATIRDAILQPGILLELPLTSYLARVVIVSAVVCAYLMAKRLAAPRLKWVAFTFLFPGFILGLVDTSESRRPRMLDGVGRMAVGMFLLAGSGMLWSNPNFHGFLVASQRPSGFDVPFFTAAGTLLALIAPYGLLIGGLIVGVRGAWYVAFGAPRSPQAVAAGSGN